MVLVTRFVVVSKAFPLLRDFGMLNAVVGLSDVVQRTPLLAKKLDTATISFLAASSVGQFCAASIHPVLDNAAWSIFLQSALVLGLWAGENVNDTVNVTTKATSIQWINYMPMMMAFVFGTIGSLLGGFVSFHVAKTLFPGYDLGHSSLVAASLTASYVGGTVNFFETASLLGGFSTIAKTKLLKLVAGVDIAVMVLYFWALTTVRNSPILRNILSPVHAASTSTPTHTQLIESVPPSTITQSIPITQPHRPWHFITNPLSSIHTLLPLTTAVIITTVAQCIQTYCSIPGVSVMFSVLSAVLVMQIWKKMVINPSQKERITTITASAAPTDKAITATTAIETATTATEITTATVVSKAMNSFCSHSRGASMYMLSMFYATIGIGARINELPSVGRPLLTIIGTLLGVHFTTLLVLSSLWNMGIRRWTASTTQSTVNHPFAVIIDVDTAVIASNACVGGAATAAQMAASFLVSSTG